MLLALCLVALVHTAVQGSRQVITNEARRRLLDAIPGSQLGTLKQVQTRLSAQLEDNTKPPELNAQLTDDAPLRGLRVAFYNRLDATRTPAEQDYIMNTLMPATATVLSRSIRVRHPSGKLPLAGRLDEVEEPIPGDPEGLLLIVLLNCTLLSERSMNASAAGSSCTNNLVVHLLSP